MWLKNGIFKSTRVNFYETWTQLLGGVVKHDVTGSNGDKATSRKGSDPVPT